MPRICHSIILFVAFWLSQLAVGQEIDFDVEIAPLLARRCLGCHAGADSEAKLDLSSKSSVLAGGESGPALSPGKPDTSLIWKRVAADEMPEDRPLPAGEKEVLKRWIAGGAQWGTDPIDPFRVSTDARAGYDWWSLQPLAESQLPKIQETSWPRNAIDRYVLAKLDAAQLKPSPPATPNQLIRRLYFDVTGLPPGLEELDAVDRVQGDYARLVDQLLAAPHYGQRWARHWLDVVRFGESHGFEYNQPRENAWWYRNWVIDAFNADLPYDEFVRQQVAGDAFYPADINAWAATGFLVAGPHNTTKPDSDKMRQTMRHDELEDIVGTIGQTFLGLTVNCARCHDHKFDPITQKEYYQLVATVAGIDHGERELPDPRADAARRELAELRAKLKPLRERLSRLEKDKSDDEAATARIDALRGEIAG